jgi:hypothetical protein
VRDSHAPLLVSIAPELTGGSRETLLFAQQLGKLWLHLHPTIDWRPPLRAWIDATPISTLNVAGAARQRRTDHRCIHTGGA